LAPPFGTLGILGRFPGFRRIALFGILRRGRLLAAAGKDAGHTGYHAHDAADGAAEHAADGPGCLVTLARAFLDALNHLRVDHSRRVQKHDGGHAKGCAQFQPRAQLRCRAGHCWVSMVDRRISTWRSRWPKDGLPNPILSFSRRTSLPATPGCPDDENHGVQAG
jgi:hypothetical protein